ncbi:MAG: quinone-dependent dihydroorotate dehydrogenase [Brevundimonas sp.]|nr:MAG: quinone-dependent dihydroorotate dehydrogenase [Brevundimonas sp.]
MRDALFTAGAAALRQFEPEMAHELAIAGLGLSPFRTPPADDPILQTQIGSLTWPNPVGLAAGLDKDGRAIPGLLGLGFGAVECGSVTPQPQVGNPKPRLFRLSDDRAIINRMGFNNRGLDAFAGRLADRPKRGVVGANLGANKDTEDKAADYVLGLKRLKGLADYFTINVSSPNTPGLRALQGRAAMDDLLNRVAEARDEGATPVFLKIAPDLTGEEIGQIVEAALAWKIDALIVSNTTLDRPASLRSANRGEAGGLSGAPLRDRAMVALQAAVEAAAGRLPLIAVGGIASGADAWDRLRAGASAVQVYSALIYEGPALVGRIKRDIAARLRAEGVKHLSELSAG